VIFPYSDAKPTLISHQSLRWFIIQRGDKFAIRLRDLEGEYLKAFQGIEYFPADPKWKINAKFIPTADKKVTIIDITGRSYQEDSPGLLEFTIDGKTYRLEAGPGETKEGFFIVFGDALAQGKGKVALIALVGVVLVIVGVKLLRDRIQKRERESAGTPVVPMAEDI
jgi:uncharacterized protein (DUF1684 family)